ncbi:hypothetical protein NDU88_000583 [Pleurodeles waltl]|uniref:Fork-head domain-containing protein n=1 Tax=Pleurodeles waltl TaxID=8319 RepID=A0AAV7V9C2_PLEWA|nr:hypothetical protein NDU88_000583 [Pleurodeles waltl]
MPGLCYITGLKLDSGTPGVVVPSVTCSCFSRFLVPAGRLAARHFPAIPSGICSSARSDPLSAFHAEEAGKLRLPSSPATSVSGSASSRERGEALATSLVNRDVSQRLREQNKRESSLGSRGTRAGSGAREQGGRGEGGAAVKVADISCPVDACDVTRTGPAPGPGVRPCGVPRGAPGLGVIAGGSAEMEEALEQGGVDIDPDFEPQSRPRSCTWPLPRPDLSIVKQEPPSEGIPVDEARCEGQEAVHCPQNDLESRVVAEGMAGVGGTTPRKGGSRRNAWGNQSYAELISQAIESSPEKRLTLSQIYEWMVKSVPFFKDKGDSNSSAGWKNSIRHNLSLHSKFIKVHNEATGKSSWWMLNPDGGKSGKAPRRRAASMDNNSKLQKARSKVSRKKATMPASPDGTADSPGSQFPKWPGSPSSRSNDDSDVWTSFRPRTSSNASTISSRLSPIMNDQDDLGDEHLHQSLVFSSTSTNVPPTVTEELELIDGLNLMSPSSSILPTQQSLNSNLMPRSASFSLRQSTASHASSFALHKPPLTAGSPAKAWVNVKDFIRPSLDQLFRLRFSDSK